MKKVAHLTTVHTPFDIRIFKKMCVTLANHGYDTHLVATHPQDETVDGVHLHGLPKASGRLARFTQGTKRCLEVALSLNADLYHFHDPELIPVGLKLNAQGKKVVYDVHENHSGSILDRKYLHPLLRPVMANHVKKLEIKADATLDAIVTATPAIAKQFTNPNTLAVQNFPILAEFQKVVGHPQSDRPRLFSFVGGMSELRGITQMVDAIETVDARLTLAGSFTPAAYEEVLKARPGWAKTEHAGWLSREDVAALLGKTRAGLVLFHPARNHIDAQPNKIFEYMAAGIPLIGSNFPLWKEIIEKEKVGLCVDPTDAKAVAQAMTQILDDPAEADAMGKRGRAAVETKFSWDAESQKLVDLYSRLLA